MPLISRYCLILLAFSLLATGCRKKIREGIPVESLVIDSLIKKRLPFPFEVQNVPFQTLGPDMPTLLLTSKEDIGYDLLDLNSERIVRLDRLQLSGRKPFVLANGKIYRVLGHEFTIQATDTRTGKVDQIGLKSIFDRYPDRWLSESFSLVGNRYFILQLFGPPKTQDEVIRTWGGDPVVFVYDLITNSAREVKVPMPDRKVARTSQYNFMQSAAINSGAALLYFMHTDSVYVLHPEAGTLDRVKLRVPEFEHQTNFRIDSTWSNDYQIEQRSVSSRTFLAMPDRFRKLVYVTVYQPCEEGCNLGEDKADILVYDSLMHYQGTITVPQNQYWACCQFVGPKGLYLSKSIKNSQYDKVFAFDCIDATRINRPGHTGLQAREAAAASR